MTEYNGWTNYETWCVASWIAKEQHTADVARELAQDALDGADGPEATPTDEEPEYVLGYTLEAWVIDKVLPARGSSMAADLLGAAVPQVNWRELARHWLKVAGLPRPR